MLITIENLPTSLLQEALVFWAGEAARETRETSASRSDPRSGECRACMETTEIESRVTLKASPVAPARSQAKSQQPNSNTRACRLLFKRPFSNAETDMAFGPVPRDFPAVVKTLMGADCWLSVRKEID